MIVFTGEEIFAVRLFSIDFVIFSPPPQTIRQCHMPTVFVGKNKTNEKKTLSSKREGEERERKDPLEKLLKHAAWKQGRRNIQAIT